MLLSVPVQSVLYDRVSDPFWISFATAWFRASDERGKPQTFTSKMLVAHDCCLFLCGPHRKTGVRRRSWKVEITITIPQSACPGLTHLPQSTAVLEGALPGDMAQETQQGKKANHPWRYCTDAEALQTFSWLFLKHTATNATPNLAEHSIQVITVMLYSSS